MDACEDVEHGAWTLTAPPGFQPCAHDAVEHESEKADQCMGADALRQSVMDRGDFDVGFQGAAAALEVTNKIPIKPL